MRKRGRRTSKIRDLQIGEGGTSSPSLSGAAVDEAVDEAVDKAQSERVDSGTLSRRNIFLHFRRPTFSVEKEYKFWVCSHLLILRSMNSSLSDVRFSIDLRFFGVLFPRFDEFL